MEILKDLLREREIVELSSLYSTVEIFI